ncbi:uncharacterized protein G2W53_041946 [Senna tora]|uniref:Uncharacterized protein n=1 Tax=Senna tora TaxID=362788 RepID=A0A834VZK1_9FABA|nr:uncharacterized protein G2W53_041946 [Senna tora]
MLQLELSWHGRSVDHVLTYFGLQITVGSQKPSRTTRQKTCCASESKTSVRVVFENCSGFDAPIGVVLAWEERGSCLKIFQMTITVESQKPSQITRQKSCFASESKRSVRVVFANRSGFDAPIAVVLEWEERGSCLNIFRTTNRVRISETFTNYEAKDLFRKTVDHVFTYTGRQITVGSQKPSRITRQKSCCPSESNTSVRVVFANRSGFAAHLGMGGAWIMSQHILDDKSRSDLRNLHKLRGKRLVAQVSQRRRFALYLRPLVLLMLQLKSSWHGRSMDHVLTYSRRKMPIGIVLAWEERGSCLNIFQTKNRGRTSKTFTNYEAKDLRSVDHVLTYSGRQIRVGSQKPSRITRQKTCCASESNTSVRVVLANCSGFDAPIGVFLAWEELGSCIKIFRRTNRGRITETFTNYEAIDLLRNESKTSVRVVFATISAFDAPIEVVLAWEEHGSCLNIFQTKNADRSRLGMGGAWIMS